MGSVVLDGPLDGGQAHDVPLSAGTNSADSRGEPGQLSASSRSDGGLNLPAGRLGPNAAGPATLNLDPPASRTRSNAASDGERHEGEGGEPGRPSSSPPSSLPSSPGPEGAATGPASLPLSPAQLRALSPRRIKKMEQRHRTRRALRICFIILTVFSLVAAPIGLYFIVRPTLVGAARYVAGLFVCLTLPISFYGVRGP